MKKSVLLPFSEARESILATIKSKNYNAYHTVELIDAVNGYLAETILSPMNIPSFNNSAMDGYVVRKQDIDCAMTVLPIAGRLLAGEQKQINWPEKTCLRIMTGAAVPQDAYAVIMQEDVDITAHGIKFNTQTIKQGQNIRFIGESVKLGTEIFTKGEQLTIAKLATLATLGINQVNIFQPLRVAIFSTGDELTPIGQPLKTVNSIYDSNRFTLKLMLKALGCEVIDLGIVNDDLNLITNTLKQAANLADIVISSGGVSIGDADYIKQALEKIGQIHFWQIAMKPGKPFAFGHIDQSLFCGLPGNPVSSIVTFYQLVRPLILGLYGQTQQFKPLTFQVKTSNYLKKTIGRMDFQRGYLHNNEHGELVVSTTSQQGSHITTSFNQANCFILLEAERGNVQKGELVNVELFDKILS
ncbi:molybdopterin molybdotransferase MoeA [Frischella sp. Ac48]|uniref:Molybdopterin molybdenumtransferase n=1 Tax=Frischella japonica TaxID=2741544 RepID=A0ABR7QY21_9GAMM|nr:MULTISPECIES: molybdopterin molybdotransferase MoeA [Frischella]MBC9131015.1 molybdopterin molybdotransferase MoeA [Frischella japonica]MBX4133840.1 molybdopterin molybdotransferase MoeA [Frischella sp. Ac48]